MQIIIPGPPIAKARHRRKKLGNGMIIDYDPQEAKKKYIKAVIIRIIHQALNSDDRETVKEASNLASGEAFDMDLAFYMPIPKSSSKRKRTALAGDCIFHNKKPDFDNLSKFYCDAANGILYHDDSQIVKGSFKKVYSENPRTVITITSLKI
jgi:Holliday junction resolvase RusA-like endonuclease